MKRTTRTLKVPPDALRCTGINKDGSRCKKKRLDGGESCFFHRKQIEALKILEMKAEVGEGVELSARNVKRLQFFLGICDFNFVDVDQVVDWLFRWASKGSNRVRMENDIFMRDWRHVERERIE